MNKIKSENNRTYQAHATTKIYSEILEHSNNFIEKMRRSQR